MYHGNILNTNKMTEYKVKHKPTGYVYIVRANDETHAINVAIVKAGMGTFKDFKIIK